MLEDDASEKHSFIICLNETMQWIVQHLSMTWSSTTDAKQLGENRERKDRELGRRIDELRRARSKR